MLDFFKISTQSKKQGVTEIYPKFIVNNKSKDLMIRGGDFYAIWVDDRGLWSTDEDDVIQIVDRELKSYYEEYIAWGIENKIVTGTSENEFSPNREITREEMAVMMANYVKYKNFKYEVKEVYFSDADTISSWALESVKILNNLKIMQGNTDGTYNPKKVATRAEIATVFYNYLNYINS